MLKIGFLPKYLPKLFGCTVINHYLCKVAVQKAEVKDATAKS